MPHTVECLPSTNEALGTKKKKKTRKEKPNKRLNIRAFLKYYRVRQKKKKLKDWGVAQ
jgi:hypothetical protein